MTRLTDVDICIEKIKQLPITYDAETTQRCIEVVSNAPTIDTPTEQGNITTERLDTPTIEAVPQWIPCSERLPEEGEVVLTQAKFKDDVKMAVSARVDFNYWTGWGTREIDIVAWMPLPRHYEVEE